MKLSNCIEIISGGTPSTSKSNFWDGDIPWISIKDFNNSFKYIYKTEKSITKQGLEKSSTNMLYKNDIIISARGTVGCLAQIYYPMAFNQSCYGIRTINKDLMQNYLYYWLIANIDKFKKQTHGAVFDTITKSTFDNIEINYPSLVMQQHIVNIIGSIDDLIEKLKSENLLYINMGNEIFKSQPTKKHIKVTNVLTFQKGLEVGSQKYKNTKNDNTVEYYRVADLNNLESTTYVDSIFLKKAAAKFGDVMITFDGCPGRVGFSVEGCYSGSLRKIIDINNEYNNGYLFFWAISENVQNCIKEYSFGTTILHASKSIDHLEIMAKPCLKILNQLNIIFSKMTLNVLTIKTLNKIKQMYLKKFFG